MLVAGGFDELPAIEALLCLLPETAYGQVLVEVPADVEPPVLAAPARMTVTRLVCAEEPGEPGARLAEAVQAWVAEWIPDEPDLAREVTLWLGGSAIGRIDPAGAALQSLQ